VIQDKEEDEIMVSAEKFIRYCENCDLYRIIRSKHCYKCGICVPRFDHHCFWVGGCIG